MKNQYRELEETRLAVQSEGGSFIKAFSALRLPVVACFVATKNSVSGGSWIVRGLEGVTRAQVGKYRSRGWRGKEICH
jgi:hypothetical protein